MLSVPIFGLFSGSSRRQFYYGHYGNYGNYGKRTEQTEMKNKGTKNVDWNMRLQLEALYNAGLSKRQIAAQLGVCLATVYNELKRGEYTYKRYSYTDYWGERHYKFVKGYSPNVAEEKYQLNKTAHGAPLKVGNDYDFIRYVEKRVCVDKISPAAVAGEIKRDNLCKTVVSKTTMYRYIAQGLFMNIRSEHLPFGQRKKHYNKTQAKRPPRGTSIEKRPLEVFARDTFGHWEMDCVIGKKFSRDTLLVFTERLTRYEIVMRMPNHKTATVVHYLNKLERRFGAKFRKVFKSITVDNGSEFSDFAGLEKSIYGGRRTSVYYCHPYTSCERGSNERLNREIRRLLPKGTDFTKYSDRQIQRVQDWVNAYPREIFGFATSAELFTKQLSVL